MLRRADALIRGVGNAEKQFRPDRLSQTRVSICCLVYGYRS